MSRIYEALKKAGFEPGTVAATELSPAPPQPAVPSSAEVLTLADIGLSNIAQSVPENAALRFEDIKERCVRSTWNSNPLANVFANPSQNPEASEQFRKLRSRLYQLRSEDSLRVLLVTSSLAGDGKTLTASNLAHAIVCQPEQRVLLVDADLRSSRLHFALGARLEPGLSDYLNGKADEFAVIQRAEQEGLYFVAGGKRATNASELLANTRLKNLIERTAPCFDWIIIDSPPCLPVADASAMAALCDGVLLVVRAGSTPLTAARKACQEFQNRNLIGVVLNAVEENTLTYSAYYDRRPYADSSSEDSMFRLRPRTEKNDA